MKLSTFLSGALLAATSSAHPSWPPFGGPHGGHGNKAVYFLRVDPAGSSIVAIDVGRNGKLGGGTSVTSTDGVGLQSTNASDPALPPTPIDPLQGQQAVSVGGDYLFTINSGSNTAVMFKIDPADPLKLSMVGSPAPTLGEFAMAIAYSSKYQKACALNGGAINGVACYTVDAEKGLVPDGVGLRAFGLPGTTPAQLGGAKGSGSDIQFSGDSSKLIAIYKGNNKPKMTLSHIYVFDVDGSGNVAATGTDNRVSPLQIPFGFALDGNNLDQFYVSEAAFGGVLVSLDYSTNKISELAVVNNTAFKASCWAVWASATDTFYDINAASPNIGRVSSDGDLESIIDYPTALGGGVDSVVDGTTLYMMTAVNVIARIDLVSGKTLQQFKYASAGNRPFWTGLAMWPADPLLSGGV